MSRHASVVSRAKADERMGRERQGRTVLKVVFLILGGIITGGLIVLFLLWWYFARDTWRSF